MEEKRLARRLKWILSGVGICGLLLYLFLVPILGMLFRTFYPARAACFFPWLIFIWVSGIPCFAVLYFTWKIAENIGADRSFTSQNADFLQSISNLAICDGGFFFVGNIILLLLNLSHPAVTIASLAIVFVGIAVAVVAAVLSSLVKKAALLQEQSDWTI